MASADDARGQTRMALQVEFRSTLLDLDPRTENRHFLAVSYPVSDPLDPHDHGLGRQMCDHHATQYHQLARLRVAQCILRGLE
jgi:hypothetical protein